MPLVAFCTTGTRQTFFILERGVRQGCPFSGLLFVIGIELLSNAIQKDPNIKGIQVGQKEIKITQYADDTTVLHGARSRCRFAVTEALTQF